MSARAPETPAPGLPPGARAGLKPCTAPPAPAADVQGDRSPGQAAPAPALGSLTSPEARGGGEASRASGSTRRCWVVALPAGLETLSLNGRLHWAQQRRRAAELKKAAWAVAVQQKIPHLDSASLLVVYHPPDRRRRDHDNIPPASGKHAIDGLVAAKVLEDDCPPNVASVSYAIGEIVKGGQLVLHITEVPR